MPATSTFASPTGGRSSSSPVTADCLAEPVEVRNLVIAPAERYEVLVDFADGRASRPRHGARCARRQLGPGMMMQMGPSRRSAAATELLMQFQPDPALKPTVTRLPRAARRRLRRRT